MSPNDRNQENPSNGSFSCAWLRSSFKEQGAEESKNAPSQDSDGRDMKSSGFTPGPQVGVDRYGLDEQGIGTDECTGSKGVELGPLT